MNQFSSEVESKSTASVPWYSELSRYQWWVLTVATLGWLFDSMDQRLFVLARTPALRDLLPAATDAEVASYAALATSIFIIGWATGGLIFGLFGDRFGRTMAMTLTILIYSVFTGLSAASVGWMDFAAYRFLCGIGIGGEYAAGVALVAEVMPPRARPYCLGLLQGLAALGHVIGSLLSYFIGPQSEVLGLAGWRWLFLFGVTPSLLVVVVRWKLREPQRWLEAYHHARNIEPQSELSSNPVERNELAKQLGDWREIFRNSTLRYHAAIGMSLGICGQIGLWGIGFWTPELIRGSQLELRRQAFLNETDVTQPQSQAARTLGEIARVQSDDTKIAAEIEAAWRREDDKLVARGTILQDIAGMCGIYAFTFLTARVGRRSAFAASYLLAFAAAVFVFSSLRTASHVYWMAPLLGFSLASVYGGFAIYFPELFPTRLRSTGIGLCYNVARYVTALGPLLLGKLTLLFAQSGASLPLRGAAVLLASIYLVGAVTTYFAPETHGRPLPD
jgi:MFS family permease